LQGDDERILYALGLETGRHLEDLELTREELRLVQRGLSDAVTATRPQVNLDTWSRRANALMVARMDRRAEREKAAGRVFVENAAREPGAERLPLGTVLRMLRPGTGPAPTAVDTVRVRYRATLIDGTEVATLRAIDVPAEVGLRRSIPCWREGVPRIHVGGQALLTCPSSLAFGDRGQPGVRPGSAVRYVIELVGIASAPPRRPGHEGDEEQDEDD